MELNAAEVVRQCQTRFRELDKTHDAANAVDADVATAVARRSGATETALQTHFVQGRIILLVFGRYSATNRDVKSLHKALAKASIGGSIMTHDIPPGISVATA